MDPASSSSMILIRLVKNPKICGLLAITTGVKGVFAQGKGPPFPRRTIYHCKNLRNMLRLSWVQVKLKFDMLSRLNGLSWTFHMYM